MKLNKYLIIVKFYNTGFGCLHSSILLLEPKKPKRGIDLVNQILEFPFGDDIYSSIPPINSTMYANNPSINYHPSSKIFFNGNTMFRGINSCSRIVDHNYYKHPYPKRTYLMFNFISIRSMRSRPRTSFINIYYTKSR